PCADRNSVGLDIEVHAYSVYCSDVYKTTGTGQHTGQPRLQVLTAKNLLFYRSYRYPDVLPKAIPPNPFYQTDVLPNGHLITWIRREDPINNVSMHTALCTCNHALTGIPSDWT